MIVQTFAFRWVALSFTTIVIACLASAPLALAQESVPNGRVLNGIVDVRYGKHEDFIRIVIDSEAPLSYRYLPEQSPMTVRLSNVHFQPIEQQFWSSYAPLTHLSLSEKEDGVAHLRFEGSSPLMPQFNLLDKDERGLFRLVIDLVQVTQNADHLAIGQEGVNSKRVRVQFADPLTDSN